MEQISKLNADMGVEEFTNLLETLEKSGFSLWKGRIVTDQDSNQYSLESLLKIFKSLKETSNLDEDQVEELRLKLIDLYQPDNTSTKIKDLFYSILAPLKGDALGKNILGLEEQKWKKIARYSVAALAGSVALAAIVAAGSKLVRSVRPGVIKDHESCKMLSEMKEISQEEIKLCNILASSPKNSKIFNAFASKTTELNKQLTEAHKKIAEKSMGFNDVKVVEEFKKVCHEENGQECLYLANQIALDETFGDHIELAQETAKKFSLSSEETLQKEGLKVLFSLYGRKDCSNAELAMNKIFSNINQIQDKNLIYLKQLVLASKSQADPAKEFLISSYKKPGLTDAQKNALDEIVTGSISKNPEYLTAALSKATDLFKKSSEIPRAIKILNAILENSAPEVNEPTRLKIIEVLKTASLNNKDEAASFLSLLTSSKLKITNQEHIVLAKEYLSYRRNHPEMKNVAFDLLAKFLTVNPKKDIVTLEQEKEIAGLIQQQLNSGLNPSNLESISKIITFLPNQKHFDISTSVFNDFATNKSPEECRNLGNFILSLIGLKKESAFKNNSLYNELDLYANSLFTKTTGFFGSTTESDKEKNEMGLQIYLILSKRIMPESFWKNMETVFQKTRNVNLMFAINKARTGENVFYKPSQTYLEMIKNQIQK